jgi:cysteine sulfinate desulfinase/cysteine desulfurase-like protein
LQGFDVTYLPVKQDGLLDLELLKETITPETVLVSVMAVNNEIGVVQPLAEIGQICRERKVFFHTDAAQVSCIAFALPCKLHTLEGLNTMYEIRGSCVFRRA